MSSVHRMRLRQGTVVVLEGLDCAGKSTQIERLKDTIASGSAMFAHVPSGLTDFSRSIYQILETKSLEPRSGLAKQLAHLACHAENMPALTEAVTHGGLVLDRCWWSTLVYGWYAGSVPESGMSEEDFRSLISTVWASLTPDVVFVFLNSRQDDDNDPAVMEGYRALADQHPGYAVIVPEGSIEDTERLILAELSRRGLVTEMSDPN